MTTKDEALALALEALEGNTTNPMIDPEQAELEDKAIAAIKQAQQAQEPVAFRYKLRGDLNWQYTENKNQATPPCIIEQLYTDSAAPNQG